MDNTDAGKLLMKVDTNIKLESVILSDENKEKISNFLNEIEHRKLFTEYGLHPMNKLLFYGAAAADFCLLGGRHGHWLSCLCICKKRHS